MPNGNELLSQVTLAGAVVYALQWLKNAGWFPWLTSDTKALNRVLSILGASVTTAGIAWTYQGSTLTITGLTLANAAHATVHVVQQFIVQQIIYDGAVAREPAAQKGTP